jgi:hypothetical protein
MDQMLILSNILCRWSNSLTGLCWRVLMFKSAAVSASQPRRNGHILDKLSPNQKNHFNKQHAGLTGTSLGWNLTMIVLYGCTVRLDNLLGSLEGDTRVKLAGYLHKNPLISQLLRLGFRSSP